MTFKSPVEPPGTGNPFARQLRPLRDLVRNEALDEAALPPLRGQAEDGLRAACRAFHLVCQSVHVIALSGPAIRTALASRRWLSLIYVESGELTLLNDAHSWTCSAGNWLLVPGCSLIWESSLFSVVCVVIPPQTIPRVLPHPGAEPGECTPPALPAWPLPLPASKDHASGLVLGMLTTLLHTTSALHGCEPGLLERLAIGEQFCRLVSVLITPAAAHSADAGLIRQAASREGDPFEELIGYIRAHLDQPLNLTVLANQSHYSRRSLQYAFRERLGCTATQWIRSQRLDLAEQRLLTAGPGDSVTKIALACGYRSLSLFSIEFQQRFHIKPSLLLRRSRSSSEHGEKHEDGEMPAEP